jgi:hypothetical protein
LSAVEAGAGFKSWWMPGNSPLFRMAIESFPHHRHFLIGDKFGLLPSKENLAANVLVDFKSLGHGCHQRPIRPCGEKVIRLAAFALACVQVIGLSSPRGVLDAHMAVFISVFGWW